MGLEIATYVSGLTASWPTSGEPKSQGDDHLRLIKGALQSTFPNATKPFYLPAAGNGISGVLPLTSQNGILFYDTTPGNISITLPVLDSTQGGWSCEVMKYSPDQNGVIVSPPSGTIYSQFGPVATIRVGAQCATAKFYWSGSTWFCSKMGALVGSTVNFDGVTIPAGHLALDGTAFNGTTFAELALALGTTTLRDKRGRVEAGVDGGIGRLTAAWFASAVNGAAGGAESNLLGIAQMPFHRHSAGIYDPTHGHGVSGGTLAGTTTSVAELTANIVVPVNLATIVINAAATGVRVNSDGGLDTTYGAGSGLAHANVQPTIVTQKLVRAC